MTEPILEHWSKHDSESRNLSEAIARGRLPIIDFSDMRCDVCGGDRVKTKYCPSCGQLVSEDSALRDLLKWVINKRRQAECTYRMILMDKGTTYEDEGKQRRCKELLYRWVRWENALVSAQPVIPSPTMGD